MPILEKIRPHLQYYRSDQDGAAAAEFALVLTLLAIPILNVVDFSLYAWNRMQLDNAAQIAVQAAWATCIPPTFLPATSNCPGMSAAVTTAAQSTSLGAGVTVSSTTENYYCVNTVTNALVTVGTFPGTKPSDCSAVGSASDSPGDYLKVTVSYAYTPVFPGVTIVSLLTTPVVREAWMRLG
jgi:Flp pilus assembly protein TadG